MRRSRRIGAIGVGAVCLAGLAYACWPDTRPLLTRAADAATPLTLAVGPNAQVSAAHAQFPHQGCTIAADPTDARRLFVASMHWYGGPDGIGVVGYSSHDGGATWRLGLDCRGERPAERLCDESVAFGPDGELYVTAMRGTAEDWTATEALDQSPSESVVEVNSSADGGVTWWRRAGLRRFADRPQIAVDGTGGPFRGRLHLNANLGLDHAAFFTSDDGGQTTAEAALPGRQIKTGWPSNPVVLPGGAVVVAYRLAPAFITDNPVIPVLRSADGGATFARVGRVGSGYRHPRVSSNQGYGVVYPVLAAEPAGLLHCVWVDGRTPDESYVLLSSSEDRGATWTAPVVVSEQPLGADAAADWQAEVPAVAVNKDGVVAVCWCDRRGLPKSAVRPNGSRHSNGHALRMRASADGGRSWGPSVVVSEVPAKGDLDDVRFWIGMAADAAGRFHPAWIGDRSGVGQVWTAAVTATP